MGAAIKPWAESAMRTVNRRLPVFHIGDVWEDIPRTGDRIRLDRVETEEGWPFSMIYYAHLNPERAAEDLDPRMGTPMLMFGRLVTRGTGKQWRPK